MKKIKIDGTVTEQNELVQLVQTEQKRSKNINTEDKLLSTMELPIIAVLLAIVAGVFDGYTYNTATSFSTFQSGNIVLSGYMFAIGNFDKVIVALSSILCFGLGAMFTVFMRNYFISKQRIYTYPILIFEVIVLILLALPSVNKIIDIKYIVLILSFVAGMQGNAFHKISGMLYGNIAVTLNVQLAFNFLAQLFIEKDSNARKLAQQKSFNYFVVLFGFAFGAYTSSLLHQYLENYTLLIAVVAIIVIILYAKKREEKLGGTSVDISLS